MRSITILLLLLALFLTNSLANDFTVKITNPSFYYVEVAVELGVNSFYAVKFNLPGGADTTLVLDSWQKNPKVKIKNLKFDQGRLASFDKKEKFQKTMALRIITKYFSNNNASSYYGQKIITVEIVRDKTKAVKLSKKAAWSKPLAVKRALVKNNTGLSITVPTLADKKDKMRFSEIRNGQKLTIMADSTTALLEIKGYAILNNGRSQLSVISIPWSSAITVDASDLSLALERPGLIYNASAFYAKVSGDYSAFLAPRQELEVKLLQGERAQIYVALYQDKACQQYKGGGTYIMFPQIPQIVKGKQAYFSAIISK